MTRGEAGAATRPWGVALIAGVVGGLLGSLIPSLVRGDASQPSEIRELDALERQVRELTQELRERPITSTLMPQRLGAEETPRASPVEPLQPNPAADIQALVARVEDLLGRLETIAPTGTGPLTIPDPTVTAQALNELLDSRKNKKRHEDDDLPPELYFMNYQQVLDRYGLPQKISAGGNGAVVWTYYDPSDIERRRALIFVGGLLADWNQT